MCEQVTKPACKRHLYAMAEPCACVQSMYISGTCEGFPYPAWRCLRARMVAGRLGSTGAERFSSRSSVFLERASSALLPGPLPRAPRRSDI